VSSTGGTWTNTNGSQSLVMTGKEKRLRSSHLSKYFEFKHCNSLFVIKSYWTGYNNQSIISSITFYPKFKSVEVLIIFFFTNGN
jgi:hypothetical protein